MTRKMQYQAVYLGFDTGLLEASEFKFELKNLSEYLMGSVDVHAINITYSTNLKPE